MAREEVSGVVVVGAERGTMGMVSECDVLRHFGKRNWELLRACLKIRYSLINRLFVSV